MNILLVLIPLTMLGVLVAVAMFFWAVNHQQFDDLDNPGILPLLEDPAYGEPSAAEPARSDAINDPVTHDPRERPADDRVRHR